MAQWGNQDTTSNSVLWAPAKVNLAPNVANRDLLFGNVTVNSFNSNSSPNMIYGVFGVDANEIAYAKAGKRGIATVVITANGTGWTARPTVAFANAVGDTTGTGAAATATGKVVAAALNGIGTGGTYIPGETLTLATGVGTPGTVLVAQTAIRTAPAVVLAGSAYVNNDIVQFATGAGTQANLTVTTNGTGNVSSLALTTNGAYTTNPTLTAAATTNATGIGAGLTITANTRVKTITMDVRGAYTTLPTLSGDATTALSTGTGVTVDLTIGVGSVTITAPGNNYILPPTVSFGGAGGSGATATSTLARGANASSAAHTGWVFRTVGTGGRAGRVQEEVLVAGGITTDASDDATLPE